MLPSRWLTARYARNVSAAQRSHVKGRATSVAHGELLPPFVVLDHAGQRVSPGILVLRLNQMGRQPTVSTRAAAVEANTAPPQAIISIAGKPKPS